MPRLALAVLGSCTVTVDGTPVADFPTAKTSALLFYLATESNAQPEAAHLRRALAGLFWPEIGDKFALQNLRNTLYYLRQTLEKAAPGLADTVLHVTRQQIGFQAAQASIDVVEFQRLLDAVSSHAHESLANCATCLDHVNRALTLYRGELLAGFSVPDAPAFEEWLLLRRELVHGQALVAASRLAAAYEARQALAEATHWARRLLEWDPYREDSHYHLMRLYARQGDPHRALAQYQALRQILRAEFGSEPNGETEILVQQIRAGQFERQGEPPRASSHAAVPIPTLYDVPSAGPFFGRRQEYAWLEQWLLHDRCRLVAVLGIGGVGKTTLAAQTVRALAEHVDIVLWRSLLNAPPLAELLPPLLQILSDQQLTDVSPSLDEQLRLLRHFLQQQRILLVFDNLESILEANQAGTYRPGYEPYGQLIQSVATHEHGSHLLLTSRERPRGYARLEGDSPLVCALQLGGLDEEAGRALLAQRGIHGETDATARLIGRYSGNPLALKLVADTVEEIFGGDISEFLTEESLVFDDVRAVLDGQFARLTALEREILCWLAIEREATPTAVLYTNLLYPPAQRSFVEALRSLQRRSLLERHAGGFALQNVVTEYLTDYLITRACGEIESGQLQILHHHAWMKAQSKTYIRESQARLIVAPTAKQLIGRLGRSGLQKAIARGLAQLREHEFCVPSYAAGNLLNLLVHLNLDQTGADFSRLNIRQAHLQGAALSDVNFAQAEFTDCTFTSNFGRIKSMAISPDSTLLALGTDDGEVRLWRIESGQLVGLLCGHRSLVISVAFSPDSRRLVSSSSLDGAIYLWDVERREVLTTLHGHRGGVEVVTFSPDGATVASGGQDGSIRLWDAHSGRLLQVLMKHTDWVTDLAFHPQGDLLASCGLDQNGCYLWQRRGHGDAGDRIGAVHYRFLDALRGHEGPIHAVEFSLDGSRLATGSMDYTVRLWDVRRRETKRILHDHRNEVRSVVFSPDGRFLASSGDDFIVRLWDVASGQLLNALHRHNHHLWAIAISSDGKTLASGGSDGIVHLWELDDPRRAQAVRTLHGYVQPIYALAVSPRGDLFATGEQEGQVHLWSLAPASEKTQPLRMLTGHAALVDSLAFSPDGRWLASGCHDKTARLWNVATGECIDILREPTRAGICIAVHPNGKLIAGGVSNSIHLWELSTSEQLRTLAVFEGHSNDVRRIAFSPDGRHLASCSIDETVRLWDIATGASLHVFDDDVHSFWSVVFSPNGDLLAGAGRSGIHMWDLRSESRTRIVYSAMAAATNIRPVAFSPDGTRLVSGGIDRLIRIWDLEKDIEIHCLVGHTADVTSTFFLPNGEEIISASYDGTVRLWNVQTGTCRQTLKIPGPYDGMDITGVTGISEAQKTALKALGAVEFLP